MKPTNGPAVEKDLVKLLASRLVFRDEGDQLENVRELAEELDASMGSVSATLNVLEQSGAVVLNRRGRLGTILESKSYARLWKHIYNTPMVISLTLPSFVKAEGLATAIYTLLDNAGFETYLTYIRGSLNRLRALREGRCNAAVMSTLAAENLRTQDEEIVLRLPPQSFVTDHRVFYRVHPSDPGQPLRVGIDPDSFDIACITRLEFADQPVQFIPLPFVQTDLHLEKSAVDAAISNIDHLQRLVSSAIASRPLSPVVLRQLGERDTAAALLIKAQDRITGHVLKKVLEPALLLDIQKKVEAGQIVPRY